MGKIKKHILSIMIISITSQMYLMLFTNGFAVSAGIITFFIIYYFYRDLNSIITGVFSGILVCLLRVLVSMVYGGNFLPGLISHFPETFFYIVIGVSLSFFMKKGFFDNLGKVFLAAFITDILANGTEMFIRNKIGIIILDYNIMGTLTLVALSRAFIVWIILNALKYYRLLLVNKENAEKYKKFLMISSGLKTEIYLMEKNMDYIEKVMAEAYNLYEKISSNEEKDTWKENAINIAKNIHEIKKDYSLVLHGLKDVTEIGISEENMYYHDITNIIEDGIKKLIKGENIDGKIETQLGENFLTSSHFYLISIFRNLLVNSVDAIANKKNGKIQFIHESNENNHIFKIIDNGTGISEKDLEYIFSPGFSTKIDYNTGNINRGLGLSIAQDIAENKLNGSIKVFSELNTGTMFKIEIPRTSLEVKE